MIKPGCRAAVKWTKPVEEQVVVRLASRKVEGVQRDSFQDSRGQTQESSLSPDADCGRAEPGQRVQVAATPSQDMIRVKI
jgi:hypothetical protein